MEMQEVFGISIIKCVLKTSLIGPEKKEFSPISLRMRLFIFFLLSYKLWPAHQNGLIAQETIAHIAELFSVGMKDGLVEQVGRPPSNTALEIPLSFLY